LRRSFFALAFVTVTERVWLLGEKGGVVAVTGDG
jgi:hypothetical protein